MKRKSLVCLWIAVAILFLFLCNLFFGSIAIPFREILNILMGREAERTVWTAIVLQSRLPQAVTALLAGASLSVCGLMLQTLFRNPLAGPGILGISNGANFGVAAVMLYFGGTFASAGKLSVGMNVSVIAAAFIGAFSVLAVILWLSARVKSNILVLIIGMMVGYLASSGISVLNSFASADNVRAYVIWGMGSFSAVSLSQLPFFCISLVIALLAAILLIKPLNALLLGDSYASNLGVNVRRTRFMILLITGFLTAVVTAFCGPVSFIGLAVPHIARMILGSSDQKLLLPASLLSGAMVALLCNLLISIPLGKGLLPLNAVTPLVGAPVIIYVILNRKNGRYFN